MALIALQNPLFPDCFNVWMNFLFCLLSFELNAILIFLCRKMTYLLNRYKVSSFACFGCLLLFFFCLIRLIISWLCSDTLVAKMIALRLLRFSSWVKESNWCWRKQIHAFKTNPSRKQIQSWKPKWKQIQAVLKLN